MDLTDLESIPWIKQGILIELSGLDKDKFYMNKHRNNQAISYEDSKKIIATLKQYGFTYKRRKNKFYVAMENLNSGIKKLLKKEK